jgi:hypothetical protein
MSFPSTFIAADIFKNYFSMVKSTVVQPPLLPRLATVSVLLFSWRGISCPSSYSSLGEKSPALRVMATSGEPSTWLPLGKLEGQEPLPLTVSRKFEIFKKKKQHFSTFSKSLDPIEL